jgi:hypothetical protein
VALENAWLALLENRQDGRSTAIEAIYPEVFTLSPSPSSLASIQPDRLTIPHLHFWFLDGQISSIGPRAEHLHLDSLTGVTRYQRTNLVVDE